MIFGFVSDFEFGASDLLSRCHFEGAERPKNPVVLMSFNIFNSIDIEKMNIKTFLQKKWSDCKRNSLTIRVILFNNFLLKNSNGGFGMYAIIETGGKQYKVATGDVLKVEKLNGDVGSDFEFDKVLLVNKDGDLVTDSAQLSNAKVIGEIMETAKDKKIIVFKFKRRKNYKRKKGHRQFYTKLKIKDIVI